jgi:preprotein translocase subunit SecY
MLGGFGNVTKIPELRKRILFVLGMLAVYRFGVFVSVPGINVAAIRNMMNAGDGSLFGLVNLLSGGALENFSIFTLGITPYITMSIIMQILTPSIPALERLKKEGEGGQRILTRYTRQLTILLAIIQGTMIAIGLERQGMVLEPGLVFRLSTALTLASGTAFIMWLGEQITERGIGNGTSIIIFAGIVARMPQVLVSTIELARTGELAGGKVLLLILFSILTVAGIVFVERSSRKIPVQYPRRMVGKRMAQAQTQYLPLKVNMVGVIPPIFASAFFGALSIVVAFWPNEAIQDWLAPVLSMTSIWHALVFGVLVFLFSYIYASIIFNPEEVAENLKKNGGFIPTVRPGKQTAEFFYYVLNRLTMWGAIYITLICIVPQMVYHDMGATTFAMVFSGTAILIAVGVTLDTASQIESHIVARNYESFMKSSSKSRGGVASMGSMKSRLLRR